MHTCTSIGRWLGVVLLAAAFVGTAHAQRTVTLTLNSATIPDTTKPTSFMEVRGAVDQGGGAGFEAPFTYTNGGATIDWTDMSTIEPVNVGGDYWQISFQVDNEVTTQFKFFSGQTDAAELSEDGWEADPNPVLGPGANDTTFALHFFEYKGAWRDQASGDKGAYDWRPFASKQDSIAVWYRVYACTDDALDKNYNPNDAGQSLSVRGDPMNGMSQLTWGADTGVNLMRESSINGEAGFDMYSGVAYYPTAAAGMTQAYKFFINGVANGWENDPNREFTVPASDTTLHWKSFSNSAPATCGAQPTAGSVVFSVDTTPLERIGIFEKARGDTLQVRGGFNGWDCDNPDDCLLGDVPGTNIFEADVALILIPGTTQRYKFFIDFNDVEFVNAFGKDPPSGWEEPITTTGADRAFTYDGVNSQFLGDQFFNDVLDGNIIETGTVDVTFSVDMTPATEPSLPQPFVAANDTPYVHLNGDAIWAFTQDVADIRCTGNFSDSSVCLFDPDGDMVYTGTFTVTAPTYSGIQYQYGYAGDVEDGAGTAAAGRRRTRFIVPNQDGTWPTEYAIQQESYQPTGALPFDPNPAMGVGIEPVDGELPASITLSANYPNPFNPSTTFEYAIDKSVHVKLQVFDVLGRLVTTLYDGLQKPATYQVTFDASRLASGVYMYRLETPDKVLTRQMLLIK